MTGKLRLDRAPGGGFPEAVAGASAPRPAAPPSGWKATPRPAATTSDSAPPCRRPDLSRSGSPFPPGSELRRELDHNFPVAGAYNSVHEKAQGTEGGVHIWPGRVGHRPRRPLDNLSRHSLPDQFREPGVERTGVPLRRFQGFNNEIPELSPRRLVHDRLLAFVGWHLLRRPPFPDHSPVPSDQVRDWPAANAVPATPRRTEWTSM